MTPDQERIAKLERDLGDLSRLFFNHRHKVFDASKDLGLAPVAISAYASGTAYALTATPALLNFGTTDPSITLVNSAAYMIFARAHIKYNAATFAANRTVTLKVRKTSGTAADVANTPATFVTDIITTQTYSAGIITLPPVIYKAGAKDVLELWGSIDVIPTAGSIDAVEAEILAIRIV